MAALQFQRECNEKQRATIQRKNIELEAKNAKIAQLEGR